jgi:hypothetical protein
MRQKFATVDRANNFTFEYENGFDDERMYPGNRYLHRSLRGSTLRLISAISWNVVNPQ